MTDNPHHLATPSGKPRARSFGNGFDDGTTVRELTALDCQPIWGDRVLLLGGSSAPFARCQPNVTY